MTNKQNAKQTWFEQHVIGLHELFNVIIVTENDPLCPWNEPLKPMKLANLKFI